MSERPYLAAEDSALLRRALAKRRGESCLEIGAGNCGNMPQLSGNFRTVVGTDLVRPAMGDFKDAAGYLLADLATPFRDSSFDLVAFNPPYLSDTGPRDVAVDAGKKLEVPKRFLAEALRVVKKNGSVVFLLNQDSVLEDFQRLCKEGGFSMWLVESERLFFEVLSVYEAGPEQRGSH